jgi:glycosyltransferase involved in cell wall biosynthesis
MTSISPRSESCSVLVPVYNAEKYIQTGLTSIIASTRQNDQIVVVDDGSTDKTASLVGEFAKQYSRVSLFSRKHLGLVNTLNYGLDCCDYDLVARADIDDLYSPKRVDIQSSYMSTNPGVAAVFSDYAIRGQNSEFLGDIHTAVLPNLTQLSLITSSRTPHPGVMFRKSVIKELGGYQEENYPTEDLALWIRVSNYANIATVPVPLLKYTLNPTGISSNSQRLMNKNLRQCQVLLSNSLSFDLIEKELSLLDSKYGNLESSPERYLSLLRDFYTLASVSRLSGKFKCAQNLLQVVSHLQVSWINSGLQMKKMQKHRKEYRLGLFN